MIYFVEMRFALLDNYPNHQLASIIRGDGRLNALGYPECIDIYRD